MSCHGTGAVRYRRSAGKSAAIAAATSIDKAPPDTIENCVLVSWATTPDSTAPSWFDAPMNSALTLVTRPRSSSGVVSWIAVLRITTLTPSAAPAMAYATIASGTVRAKPNAIMARPKASTAPSSTPPTPRCTGRIRGGGPLR
jgi:hypothetical protein